MKACAFGTVTVPWVPLSAPYHPFSTSSNSNIRNSHDCATPSTAEQYNPSLDTNITSLLFSLGANSLTML